MRVLLEIFRLGLARVIIEAAERMDRHDERDYEEDDRALVAVAAAVGGLAPVKDDPGTKDHNGGRKLDHPAVGHDGRLHLMSRLSRGGAEQTARAKAATRR